MKNCRGGYTFAELLTAITIVAMIIGFLGSYVGPFPGCFVRQGRAVEALRKAGYADVKIVDRNNCFIRLRGGGKGDKVRFTCQAKNPAGVLVDEVYVYCGWPFKGTTIRTD